MNYDQKEESEKEYAEENTKEKEYFVYMLATPNDKKTYVGATVDLNRRLRQHNGEIKGGARATHRGGNEWRRVCYVKGFPDWRSALQFEWKWKQIGRKIIKNEGHTSSPVERRMKSLEQLMSMKKSTTNAIPFSEYKLEVVFE
jgi:structure-specific endonuclease subunit SLX1